MEDKQKKYLDKVVEFIVRDTIIDYDKEEIHYPFETGYHYPYPLNIGFYSYTPEYDASTFQEYCKDIYGLTGEEIDYVWERYKSILHLNIYINKYRGRI